MIRRRATNKSSRARHAARRGGEHLADGRVLRDLAGLLPKELPSEFVDGPVTKAA